MSDILIIFNFAERPKADFYDVEGGEFGVEFDCGFEGYCPALHVDAPESAYSKSLFYCYPTDECVDQLSESFPIPENSILTLLRRYGGKAKVLKDGNLIARYKADAERLNVKCQYTAKIG